MYSSTASRILLTYDHSQKVCDEQDAGHKQEELRRLTSPRGGYILHQLCALV
jgi:hypothetical protein